MLTRIKCFAILFSVMICLPGMAGCQSGSEFSNESSSTNGVQSADSSSLGEASVSTSFQTQNGSGGDGLSSKTTSSSGNQISSGTTTRSTTKAKVVGILVSGNLLSEFKQSCTSYTYVLQTGTTAAPAVTAIKSNGTGELTIVQAGGPNGKATVSINGTTYTVEFKLRDASMMLNNTYYKLTTSNKLNVAYFGGSVTDGYGSTNPSLYSWRALTTKWLEEEYPNATIHETNASIGGTGSMFGAYRAVEDLKLKSATDKPDLVFVEFAINDVYDGADSKTYAESIVKTIYKYAPQADIVFVFTTNFSQKDDEYNAIKQQKAVADAYLLPYVSVGAPLWKEIVKENGGQAPVSSSDAVWKKYFTDSVHPSNAGYAKYASYVTGYLDGIFSAKANKPSSCTNAYTPATTLSVLPESPYIANLKGQTPESPLISVDSGGYITSQTEGVSFTFTFTGTDLKLWVFARADGGSATVTVDNGSAKNVSLSRSPANHTIFGLASGLENKKHTVKVTLSKTSSGSMMDLRYFLISGDPKTAGIQLISG